MNQAVQLPLLVNPAMWSLLLFVGMGKRRDCNYCQNYAEARMQNCGFKPLARNEKLSPKGVNRLADPGFITLSFNDDFSKPWDCKRCQAMMRGACISDHAWNHDKGTNPSQILSWGSTKVALPARSSVLPRTNCPAAGAWRM